MGLDYSGKPNFKKDRDLLAARKSFYAKDSIPLKTAPDAVPEADQLFDGLTKVYLKGEALRKGLSEMAPAAYIPVDAESAVIAAIQRVAPDQGNFKIITYGLFAEACDGIAKRAGAINEEFMSTNAKIVDESQLARVLTRTVRGQSDTENDQLSAFLDSLIPLAGVILAGYMNDAATTAGGKVGTDSMGGAGEVPSAAAPGSMLGLSYLIELGMTLAMFLYIYNDMGIDPKVKDDFERLERDPEERKKIFADAGVDYDKVRKNQRWNDYKAIKEYSIKYVHRNSDTGQYDHWIAYTATVDQQSAIRSSLAMAPKFSEKWQSFYERGGSFSTAPIDVEHNAEDIFETAAHMADVEAAAGSAQFMGSSGIAGQLISELSVGLKGYLSGLITGSSDTYDKTAQAFYFQLDERIVCCLVYFVGPINTDILKTISAVLQLMLMKASFSISDFIENLINSIFNTIIQMLNTYLHQLVSQIIDKIYKLLAKIPVTDLEAALVYCLGLEIILKILDEVTAIILEFVAEIIKVLEDLVMRHIGASKKFMEVSIEKRAMLTLAAMLDALASKIEDVQDLCAKDPDSSEPGLDYEFQTTGSIDEIAAMKAINFVQEELPNMFPILNLSEDVRRKHFSDVAQFNTEKLGVPVAGFDGTGGVDYEDLVQGCADNSPATKITELANKIATAINETE